MRLLDLNLGIIYSGIEIHVTLSHLDYPQILEDEYHGWLSPRMV
jgi:beta-glucosidase